jgi:hypothetical protein
MGRSGCDGITGQSVMPYDAVAVALTDNGLVRTLGKPTKVRQGYEHPMKRQR